MTFLNDFYGNNAGLFQLANTASHLHNARNTSKIAASQQALAEDQAKTRASQERMERDNREHNKKILEIEQSKADDEKKRRQTEEQMKEAAAHFRKLASFSLGFAKQI